MVRVYERVPVCVLEREREREREGKWGEECESQRERKDNVMCLRGLAFVRVCVVGEREKETVE